MKNATSMMAIIKKIRVVKDEADYLNFLETLKPAAIDRPVTVAFINAHAFNMCYRDPAFLKDIMACDYVLRDGSGMKLLYKMLRLDPGLNMNGTDFIPRILHLYEGKEAALFGTDNPYLDRAAKKIEETMGVKSPLRLSGFQGQSVYARALAKMPLPLAVLAMGMPKQERVAQLITEQNTAPCLIVCGGAILDFLGEKVTRAPIIFRKIGMEWLYRLLLEPRRLFGRYVIGNFVFMIRAARLARYSRKSENHSAESSALKKLKILHVVRQYDPSIGGLESYVKNMVRHQSAAGHECHVLTLNKVFHGGSEDLPEFETIDGVPVRRVGFKGRRRFFIPMVAPSYFKQFDLVHVHNTDVFFDYISLIGLFTKTPCFATTHGGFFHTKDFSLIKTLYFNVITRLAIKGYREIFAISQNDYDTFKPLTDKMILLPNAIEPLGAEIVQGKDLVYIGRLSRNKDIEKLIAVFALLKTQYNFEGKLHIIGPEWDVTIAELSAAAKAHKVENDIVFHGAATPQRMREIAKGCGYFASASSFEGFGMSMLEGMSIGMIPLVHNNESFKHLIDQSGVGLYTDFNHPEQAAAQIARTLPTFTEENRKAAQIFSRKFSWDELIARTFQSYAKAFQ